MPIGDKVKRKKFAVLISYKQVVPNSGGGIVKADTLTTIQLYKLITLFNNSDHIQSVQFERGK